MIITLADVEQIMRMTSYVATPFVAIAAAAIAWQQMRINHWKLRNDQCDRRVRLYQEVAKILSIVVRGGGADADTLSEFRSNVAEADFLFGPEIMAFIEDIYSHGFDLWDANEEFAQLNKQTSPNQAYLKRVIDVRVSEKRWFRMQFSVAKEHFKRYLHIAA